MSVRLRTPTNIGETLCRSCSAAHRTVDNQGAETIVCMALAENRLMKRPVAECSSYEKVGAMTKYQMEKLAWVIEIKENRYAGFMPPKRKDDDL